MNSERVAKVAIIGGGCAAIATAFELSRPELKGRFDITVYQPGWRLGGKGASGRGPSGRIQEHGLHIWLGFYENAFRLLRECYEELAIDPGNFDVSDWRSAFIVENDVGLSSRSSKPGLHNWSATFPPRPGLPGDPISTAELLSLPRYIARALDLLETLIKSTDSRRQDGGQSGGMANVGPTGFSARSIGGDPRRLLRIITDVVGGSFAVSAAVLVEALAVLQVGLKMLPPALTNPLNDLAEWIAHHLRKWLERSLMAEPYFQHVWELMDIVVATVVGSLRAGLLTDPRGFDAIDDYDWREWLLLNGASERSVQSAFICGLYDLVMSYEDGARPRLAASSALRGTLMMFFNYRGALYWRLRAGMGDVIFAPYYEVLRRRGVKFEFFHRLNNVRLASEAELQPGERPFVTGLDFDVQAKIKGGGEYAPLIEVKGRPCWPATPDLGQLEEGERFAAEGWDFESHWDTRHVEKKSIEVVKDFDFVVLGLSVATLPYVCGEILARDPRWRAMVENVKTTATQAFQIWLKQDLRELGWTAPNFLGSANTKPFNAWCDLAHTIPEEDWSQPPRTVLYFCAALAEPPPPSGEHDPDHQASSHEQVRLNALSYLRETGCQIWPGAYDARGDFRWDLLASGDAAGSTQFLDGESRFSTQYWTANINPSDRYVLAVPGSAKYRISPLDMSYDNLTIAGDWTDCGLNEGCVEAAVISGRLAAHALSGLPRLEDIVGYDHP